MSGIRVQRRQWGPLGRQHVLVEARRPADRLSGVVDDEIKPRVTVEDEPTESLDAGGVPQVEAEDLEPAAPHFEVSLGGVPGRGVSREASGNDHSRAAAAQ